MKESNKPRKGRYRVRRQGKIFIIHTSLPFEATLCQNVKIGNNKQSVNLHSRRLFRVLGKHVSRNDFDTGTSYRLTYS